MRNTVSETALPMRDYGSFLPGTGVGGAGVHWNGHTWRFDPADFQLKTHLSERYGAGRIAEGGVVTLELWEPHLAGLLDVISGEGPDRSGERIRKAAGEARGRVG